MPQTILRKHNIQRAQYLYNDSIGIELQVLEMNNAPRKRDIVKNAVTNFAIGCLVNKLRMRIFTWLVEAGRRNATVFREAAAVDSENQPGETQQQELRAFPG